MMNLHSIKVPHRVNQYCQIIKRNTTYRMNQWCRYSKVKSNITHIWLVSSNSIFSRNVSMLIEYCFKNCSC